MLEKLKEAVVRCAQETELRGLCCDKSGNCSCRDRETGLLLMTPTGADRQTMTADDIVVMDMTGKVVESLNGLKPTSEALMHIAAYEVRPDVSAVVHTHSRSALTFAALEQAIPAFIIEAAHLCPKNREIPIAPFARQGTAELGESVKKPLLECDAVLLARHGVLTVADTLSAALVKAVYVEAIANVYYRALMIGDAPKALSQEDLQLSYPPLVKIPEF